MPLARGSAANPTAASLPDIRSLLLQMSYVEIYNEVVQDLLAAQAPMTTSASSGNLVAARALYGGGSSNGTGGGGNSPRRMTGALDNGPLSAPGSPLRSAADGEGSSGGGSISIYENAAGQIVLDGVTEVPLKSSADLAMLLQRGTALRATAAHRYGRGAAVARTANGACSSRRSSACGGHRVVVVHIIIAQVAAGRLRRSAACSPRDGMPQRLPVTVRCCGTVSEHKCRLNQQSSRSHSILSLTLQQRAHGTTARTLPAELRCLYSKLHLVDLAGSERAKETGTTGVTSHTF